MWWLWIVVPLLILGLYFATDRVDQRRARELEAWRASVRSRSIATKRVGSLPSTLARALAEIGGGKRLGHYELVPRLAYLSVMAADVTMGSDYQTVVAKLEEAAPPFRAFPIPLVEGKLATNDGIVFKKDDEWMETFITYAGRPEDLLTREDLAAKTGKSIKRWLSAPIRDALRDVPEAFLQVDGVTMTLTIYGRIDKDDIQRLVAAADVAFAEHGAGGGVSLLGEDDEDDEVDEPSQAEESPA